MRATAALWRASSLARHTVSPAQACTLPTWSVLSTRIESLKACAHAEMHVLALSFCDTFVPASSSVTILHWVSIAASPSERHSRAVVASSLRGDPGGYAPFTILLLVRCGDA